MKVVANEKRLKQKKILQIKHAKGDAESKYLAGLGKHASVRPLQLG